MRKKLVTFIIFLVLFYIPLSCKQWFTAVSEPVNNVYYQTFSPRTGQTTCYERSCTTAPCPTVPCAGTGQDGEYQRGANWPSPRFRDNGNGTVTDRLTGLMWQQNGSAAGTKNWQSALGYVKTLSIGGYSDWRLPNINELKSLVHYGQASPAGWLNTQGFTDIQNSRYWSSNTAASFSVYTDSAWYVGMNNGDVFWGGSKSSNFCVLAVRGNGSGGALSIPKTGQTSCYEPTCTTAPCPTVPCAGTGQDGEYQMGVSWPSPRFKDNGNGTVTDRLTGLIWIKDGNIIASRDPGFDTDGTAGDGMVKWQHALEYVAKLNYERYLGYSDWRLPNASELETLVNYGLSPAGWLNMQGFSGVLSQGYWSACTIASQTGHAWIMFLSIGYTKYDNTTMTSSKNSSSGCVLAVRGGY